MSVPVVRLTLPVPPASNRYWRCWRGRIVKSAEARAYALQVRAGWLLATRGRLPFVGAVVVKLRWFRAARRGDLDGRLKIVLDCLQGLAYGNDAQIVRLFAERHEDRDRPRLEVEVEQDPVPSPAVLMEEA